MCGNILLKGKLLLRDWVGVVRDNLKKSVKKNWYFFDFLI